MSTERSAKEDIPTPREYRALLRAAREKVDMKGEDTQEFRLECTFIIRVMGEVGLRGGELAHLSDEWVDYSQNIIEIPNFDRCEMGQDGGACGYCKHQARLRSKKRDDTTYETALREYWQPKTESSARRIWFGWDEDLVEIIDEFLYKNDRYTGSRASVNRRIDRIAEACERVEKEDVYPNALRAHAAKFHSVRGMRAYHLKEFMGWSDVDGAMDYIKMSSSDIESELRRIHEHPHGR